MRKFGDSTLSHYAFHQGGWNGQTQPNSRVRLTLPVQPSDVSARLVLGTGGGGDGSIPITLRSLVPLGSSGGSFNGALTGGNGRMAFGAQTFTFQFDVPGGQSALNLALRLRDAGYNSTGLLVDPGGEPLDIQTTRVGATFTNAMQFFEKTPRAGRLTAALNLVQPSGPAAPRPAQ